MTQEFDLEKHDDFPVTMDHCRKAGFCPSGVRRWFGQQGLDFRAFMRSGMLASEFLKTGDAQGARAVQAAWKQENRDG